MNKILTVQSKEYRILNILPPGTENLLLAATNLDEEIACTFFSLELNKVALARNIDIKQLQQLFHEINPSSLQQSSLINVRIIGGDESKKSREYLYKLVDALNTLDNGSNIINIISTDTCNNFHPNSFILDCYHGGIREISAVPLNNIN